MHLYVVRHAIAEDANASDVRFDSIGPLLVLKLNDRFDEATAHRLSREFTSLLAVISSSRPAVVGHR